MYRSILVPLDGSLFGEQALPPALNIAGRASASIEVAHVHETLAPIFSHHRAGMEGAWEKEIRAQRNAYLDGVVKRLTTQTKVPIVRAFLEGSVVDAILDSGVEPEDRSHRDDHSWAWCPSSLLARKRRR